jgi:hypothetical protein
MHTRKASVGVLDCRRRKSSPERYCGTEDCFYLYLAFTQSGPHLFVTIVTTTRACAREGSSRSADNSSNGETGYELA